MEVAIKNTATSVRVAMELAAAKHLFSEQAGWVCSLYVDCWSLAAWL
jgi:hypothetical protein